MIFKPHRYQEYAIQRIIDTPAIMLAIEMGLGKSVATLSAILDLKYNYFEVDKVLVIAPLRVAMFTWAEEISKWDHLRGLRLSKVLGSSKQRIEALNSPADIYVTNRENVVWLTEYYGSKWPFDMVVIDESSSFKSHKAQRFKALKKVRPLIKRIVALTGTPAPNSLLDLWPQIYLLDRGDRICKTITGFRERYFQPDKRDHHIVYSWKLKPGAGESIYQKIDDICVSMKAKDWLDMPDRVDNVIQVELDERVKDRYRQMEKDLLLPYKGGDVVANNAAALSNKLLQMANGAVYDEHHGVVHLHDSKLEALEEILECGSPVLVFYWYKHDYDRLIARFPQVRTLNTEEDIRQWNVGDIPLLLAHPASAGHGLNLQAGGNVIVWFSLTWSLELYEQANARLHRQGQNKGVIVHHLVATGTMDERVMTALRMKTAGQQALMEAVKARIEEVRNSG